MYFYCHYVVFSAIMLFKKTALSSVGAKYYSKKC